jgi:alcohol dehydrogenase class IV
VSTAFELATPSRVLFGAGRIREVPDLLRGLGARRTLFVVGRSRERTRDLERALAEGGLAPVVFSIPSEPTIEMAREGTALAVESGCDSVVALGGGSALDGGKAIAALAANGGDPLDYLEVIGLGVPLRERSIPLVAIPTTAGTGSEVTRNAVLASKEAGAKASLRSHGMLPAVAVVDPDLLAFAPPTVLASSGLDALSQLIEPFLSKRSNPVTDALAREGMRRSARSLRRAVLSGADEAAREDLAIASLFGGLCLANAGLGAVHGFAAPAGGMFDAPHGAVCAALLPAVLAVNLRAIRARGADQALVDRFREVATILTENPAATADDASTCADSLVKDLGIPSLRHYGLRESDVAALVERAKAASSMKANPIVLTDADLVEIVERSL